MDLQLAGKTAVVTGGSKGSGIDVLVNDVGVGDHDTFAQGVVNTVLTVSISPGPVSTGVWIDSDGFVGRLAQAEGIPHEAFVTQMLDGLGIPTRRMSTPEEVARLIAFAASPDNITGADHLIDGGVVKSA